jgi:hypothetical protein
LLNYSEYIQQKDSYTLEAISDEELGEGKIELDGDHRTAPFKDFENYFIYSLVDSYRLYQLEEKNNDLISINNLNKEHTNNINKKDILVTLDDLLKEDIN